LESHTNGFDSKRRPKQLPHAARSPPHALLLRNAIDDASARCPALAPARAAPEAYSFRRSSRSSRPVTASSTKTSRRTSPLRSSASSASRSPSRSVVGVSEADATSFSHRNPLHSCGVDASVLLRLCEGHCSPRRRRRFRREIGNRGSRCVIHGRCRLFPLNLREMGKCNSHEACGLTSVALQSRENELSFLVLDDAKFRALVWHGGVHRSAASFCGLHLLDGVEVARTSSLFGAAGPAICVLFRRITRSTCPRSRPGHRPEVGPPVRLIYGDVAGLRNGGARTPYIIAAMA